MLLRRRVVQSTSDHNVLSCEFEIKYRQGIPKVRRQFLNFKSRLGQQAFFNETNDSNNLSYCFKNTDFRESSKLFFKHLNKKLHKSFDLVRVKTGGTPHVGNKLIQSRMFYISTSKSLLSKTKCDLSRNMLKMYITKAEHELSDIVNLANADKTKAKIIKCVKEGRLDNKEFWKMKRQHCPRQNDPPMAKRNDQGILITEPSELKNLYLQTYCDRMRNRDMLPELADIFTLKTELWRSRLSLIECKDTKLWTHDNLDVVLSQLKANKSMDPNGMTNEIFKHGCLGQDLRTALLNLFNGCKENQFIPTYMSLSNITSLHKNKGSRLNLENDR